MYLYTNTRFAMGHFIEIMKAMTSLQFTFPFSFSRYHLCTYVSLGKSSENDETPFISNKDRMKSKRRKQQQHHDQMEYSRHYVVCMSVRAAFRCDSPKKKLLLFLSVSFIVWAVNASRQWIIVLFAETAQNIHHTHTSKWYLICATNEFLIYVGSMYSQRASQPGFLMVCKHIWNTRDTWNNTKNTACSLFMFIYSHDYHALDFTFGSVKNTSACY